MSAVAPQRSQAWLYGPLPDLVLGAGLGYAAIFSILAIAGPEIRSWLPYGLAPLLALVSGTPHYGATLLRVYESRENRRAYAIFAVWATLGLAAAFVAGLNDAWIGSWILTIYLTWSPYHYTGQNYGIALMFLRRRKVEITPATKRWIHAAFLLGFGLTLLAIHGAVPETDYAPIGYHGTDLTFLSLGIPDAVRTPLMLAIGAVWLVAHAASALGLRRAGARWGDLGPAAAVAATQALWFAVPVAARQLGALQGVEPLSQQYAAYAFLWVAAGHAVQYLWVTSYYARSSPTWSGHLPYLAKCVLAGAAIWVVPALIFAPGMLGSLPFDAGLAVMVAAIVNLHHFILDGAIWKLRDGRVARILIRSQAADDAGQRPAPLGAAARFAGPLVWVAGAIGVAVLVLGTLEEEYGFRQALARGDRARVEQADARLRWLGRESAVVRMNSGVLAAEDGDHEVALRRIEESIALHPTPEAYRMLGWVHQRAGQSERAIAAYRQALELRPGWLVALNNLAWLRATHENPVVRDPRRAIELAEQAVRQTGRRDPHVLDTLAAAYASGSRFPDAVRVGEAAVALAEARGESALARELAARLEGYRSARAYAVANGARARGLAAAAPRWTVYNPDGQAVDTIEQEPRAIP